MALIGQNQQTQFTSPANGDSPIDADAVRANDNSLRVKFNTHDADATIHVQTGLLAARPAASTPFAMYLDENERIYVDTGSAWVEIPYARLDAVGTNAFTGSVTVGGTLGVTGDTTLDDLAVGGNATVVGNLIVTGSITGGTLSGTITVPAASVSAGTFAAGNFVFQGNVTTATGTISGGSVVATAGKLQAASGTATSSGAISVDYSVRNHARYTLSGNATFTLTGGSGAFRDVFTLEVLQNGTGGFTTTFANVVWAGGVAPTATTTANRKDVYTFLWDGASYLGTQFGANFASTG